MKKKLTSLLVIATLAVTMLAGCSKKATVESILTDCNENLKTVESSTVDVDLDLKLVLKSQGIEMPIDLEFYAELMQAKNKDMYINGTMNYSMLGQEGNQPVESYIDFSDDMSSMVTYTFDAIENIWSNETTEVDKEELDETMNKIKSLDIFKFLMENKDSFTLAEELVKYREKECYNLTGSINMKKLYDYIENSGILEKEEVSEKITEETFDPKTLENINLPFTVYVYKADMIPAYLEMDLKSMMTDLETTIKELLSSFSEEEIDFVVETLKFTFNFKDFNKTEVEIPAEVKTN